MEKSLDPKKWRRGKNIYLEDVNCYNPRVDLSRIIELISSLTLDPMARIIKLQELEAFLPREDKGRIVLTGGCFDILHIGHVRFFSEAKKMGNYLVVLLENDEKVRKLKGKNRPIFTQEIRAEMLSALICVDMVVLLPMMENDSDYMNLVMKIKPDIIAATENDPRIDKKRRQAKSVGGKLKVVSFTKTLSTSALARIIGVD